MLVIESLDHASARKAEVYAEVRGYAMTNDAHDMLAPLPNGHQAARAIRLAMADAGVEAADVDYVNAHASATPIGDRAEARAIQCALGEFVDQVPVSGTKGLYGHPLGASGAIETAISALAISRGHLPGTTNLSRPDADNPLKLIGPAGVTSAGAITTSWALPGLSSRMRGRPSASVSAWIFVVRPPRERPMASRYAPLFRRPPSDGL